MAKTRNVTANSNLIFVWRSAIKLLVVPKIWFPKVQLTHLTKEAACPGILLSWKYQSEDLRESQ